MYKTRVVSRPVNGEADRGPAIVDADHLGLNGAGNVLRDEAARSGPGIAIIWDNGSVAKIAGDGTGIVYTE